MQRKTISCSIPRISSYWVYEVEEGFSIFASVLWTWRVKNVSSSLEKDLISWKIIWTKFYSANFRQVGVNETNYRYTKWKRKLFDEEHGYPKWLKWVYVMKLPKGNWIFRLQMMMENAIAEYSKRANCPCISFEQAQRFAWPLWLWG